MHPTVRLLKHAFGLAALWSIGLAAGAQAELATPDIRFDNPLKGADAASRQLGGVLSIAQDEHGFIWLASENGLGRYDGHDLRLYQADPSSPEGLPTNYIWDLTVDQDGVLWQAGEGGLSYYSHATETFTHLKQIGGTEFTSEVISALAVGEDNTLYAAGPGSLHIISPDRQSMQVHLITPPVASGPNVSQVRELSIDPDGHVWVATAGMGVAVFDPGLGTFDYWLHEPGNPDSIAYNNVRAIMHDDRGRTWFGTYGRGISRLDRETGTMTHFRHDSEDKTSLAVDIVWDITQDSEGSVWVALDQGGLARFDENAGAFHRYQHSSYDPQSLVSDQVRVVFEDRNQDLWIGAFPGGVSFYNRSTQLFHHYTERPYDPTSLSSSAILSFLEASDGTIWVGTEGGLNALDPATGNVRRYQAEPSDPEALKANPVLSLAEDIDGQIWVGTWAGGLHRFDPQTETFTRYTSDSEDPESINDDFIWSLMIDHDDTLWIGTENGGLNRYHRDTDSFSHYRHDSQASSSISGNYVPALLTDHRGQLWVGTFTRLEILDPETGRFSPVDFVSRNGTTDPAGSQNIHALYEDSRNRIWAGTQHHGVSVYDPDTEEVAHLSTRDGLPSSYVGSIVEDDEGSVWLATTSGLAQVDSETLSVKNTLSREDGLAGSHYNRDASLKTQSGQLYFGSTEGVTAFDPAKLFIRSDDFPVVITQLRILNQDVAIGAEDSPLTQSILATRALTLTHEDIMFSFELAALNYRQSDTMRYSYRLEGFDRDWNDIGRNTTATYTSINPGEYRFRTRASTDGEHWVEGQSLAITIQPPPWRSGWAYLIYATLFAVMLWFAHKYVTLRIRSEAYRNKSLTDPLTHLHNRAGVAQVADGIFANPITKKGVCLMLLDIDHFKRINDRRGHDAGDRILCDVTRVVRDCLRSSDHFGRWGGEEFVLFCPTHGHTNSYHLAEKVRKAVESHIYEQHSPKPVRVTVSIGVADIKPDDTFESALKHADNALYKAKNMGRNCVAMAE